MFCEKKTLEKKRRSKEGPDNPKDIHQMCLIWTKVKKK